MPGVDSLPPDQKAVLQLVLGQGRSYEDLAGLLGIGADAVRGRAIAASETLGPEAGGRLAPERRGEIVDFLLSQGGPGQRQATREYLSVSAGGRAWARALAGELRPLGTIPEIPEEAPERAPPPRARAPEPAVEAQRAEEPMEPAAAAPAPRAPRAPRFEGRVRAPSSRLGGALLLGGIGVVVAVLIIVLVSGGGGGDNNSKTTASTSTSAQTSTSTQPRPEAQVNLRGPRGSKALGVAQIVSTQGQRAMALVAQGLAASPQGYVVWLYNSATDVQRLGFTQAVKANGRLSALAPLPSNAARFKQLVVSRETTKDPKTPSTIVLSGPLSLSG
jgi:hypothetical protein